MLARFIPVVRTVLNPLAGALDVPARTFTIWQVAGGLVWSAGVTLAGYTLGSAIPGIDSYLLPAIAVIVLLSLIPIGVEVYRTRSAIRRGDGAGTDDGQHGAGHGSSTPGQATGRRPVVASQRRAGHDDPGDQ